MEASGMNGSSGRAPIIQGFGGWALILNPTESILCPIVGGARRHFILVQGLAGEQAWELAGRRRSASPPNRLSRPQIGEIAGPCSLGFRSERRQCGGGQRKLRRHGR